MATNSLELYARGRRNIWTDRYIAKNLLAAHLDPEGDGASRNLRTIERTVDWIDSVSEGRRSSGASWARTPSRARMSSS